MAMKNMGAALLCALLGAACGGDDDDAKPARAECGNGILEANEACEGFELRDATCASEGFSAGRLTCKSDCTLDTSACTTCGDGLIEGEETCEPEDLGTTTCAGLVGPGYTGTPTCSPDCTEVSAHTCIREVAAGNLNACDPEAASPCEDSALSCVATTQGEFCLEDCNPVTPNDCGNGRFCYDLDGQGLCVDVPDTGDVCTQDSGCTVAAEACVPMFSQDSSVSVCAPTCLHRDLDQGQGSCDSGMACMRNPGDQVEVEDDDPCTDENEDSVCSVSDGYSCTDVLQGTSTVKRCARPHTVCAEPIPFFGFGNTEDTAASVCDLGLPTQGLRLCGIASAPTILNQPARIECYPLFDDTAGVGVCVGFCDPEIGSMDGGDLQCGDTATCQVPTQPEFFFAESETPVTCALDDLSNCGVSYPFCVDLGDGLECARAVKVCVQNPPS